MSVIDSISCYQGNAVPRHYAGPGRLTLGTQCEALGPEWQIQESFVHACNHPLFSIFYYPLCHSIVCITLDLLVFFVPRLQHSHDAKSREGYSQQRNATN